MAPDQLSVLSGGQSNGAPSAVRVWSWDSKKELRVFLSTTSDRSAVAAFSPDGRLALAGSEDGSVRLWDLRKDEKQQPTVLVGHTRSITSVAYAPDGTKVAASAEDGKVFLWDVGNPKPRQKWELPGAVHAVTFDAQSRYLALANANATAFILRLEPITTGSETK
jgi:WD40 repeat protein